MKRALMILLLFAVSVLSLAQFGNALSVMSDSSTTVSTIYTVTTSSLTTLIASSYTTLYTTSTKALVYPANATTVLLNYTMPTKTVMLPYATTSAINQTFIHNNQNVSAYYTSTINSTTTSTITSTSVNTSISSTTFTETSTTTTSDPLTSSMSPIILVMLFALIGVSCYAAFIKRPTVRVNIPSSSAGMGQPQFGTGFPSNYPPPPTSLPPANPYPPQPNPSSLPLPPPYPSGPTEPVKKKVEPIGDGSMDTLQQMAADLNKLGTKFDSTLGEMYGNEQERLSKLEAIDALRKGTATPEQKAYLLKDKAQIESKLREGKQK